MNTVNALDLAGFILATYPQKAITPMKLQKLAWYVKAWSLVAGEKCVDVSFKKWDFGPVNTILFRKYKVYSKKNIPSPCYPPHIDEEKTALFKFILDNYVDMNAVALSNMTHKEDPWEKTFADQYISDADILGYYSKQSFAKNFQGKKFNEGEFWVLKTNAWYSFTMDMDEYEADLHESFDSYDDYVKHKDEAKQLVTDLWNAPITINH